MKKERDWYDRATLAFQVVFAALGIFFTYLQFERNGDERAAQTAADNLTKRDTRREVVTKYLLDAVRDSYSKDGDEKQRGLKLLALINTDNFFETAGLKRGEDGDLVALISASQNISIDSQSSQGDISTAAAQATCAETLGAHGTVGVSEVSRRDCWIYLGWYKGRISKGRCAGPGVWISQYLEFANSTCPRDLVGRTLTVAQRTGALYVRTEPATPHGLAPAVGGIYPKQRVTIDQVQSSAQDHNIDQDDKSIPGSGQLWGRVSNISS